jgi:Shedu protein SduA, C-terminal
MQHSYVLPQMFSVPAVVIGDKAYVGGTAVDRKDARFVDYLFAGETSKDALLVEITTPVTKLLGSEYRNVYRPSPELSGAVVQILDNRRQLVVDGVNRASETHIPYFNPRCLLLIGNGAAELTDRRKRQSFEIFRAGMHEVEILTFDELFHKIEAIAKLVGLVRQLPLTA